MTSYIRSGTSLALAPVRRASSLLHWSLSTLSSSTSASLEVVRQSISYLRRDRSAQTAALMQLGPLIMEVLREPSTEEAVRQMMEVLRDAIAVVQREEVAIIAQQTLSLAQSQPVRDLVRHLHTTVMALMRMAQSPAVVRLQEQLQLYISLIAGPDQAVAMGMYNHPALLTQSGASDKGLYQSSSSPSIPADEDTLNECVQLLLLVERLSHSSQLTPSTPSFSCTCASDTPSSVMQPYFSDHEASILRKLARRKDEALVMLYRFAARLQQQERQLQSRRTGKHRRTMQQQTDEQEDGEQLQSQCGKPPSNASRMMNGHCNNSSTPNTVSSSSSSSSPSHPRSRASSSPPSIPIPAAHSYAHSYAAVAGGRCVPSPIPSAAANSQHKHQHRSYSFTATSSSPHNSVDYVDEENNENGAEEEEQDREKKMNGHAFSMDADDGLDDLEADDMDDEDGDVTPACPYHVPQQHARFVFTVRELLSDMKTDGRV